MATALENGKITGTIGIAAAVVYVLCMFVAAFLLDGFDFGVDKLSDLDSDIYTYGCLIAGALGIVFGILVSLRKSDSKTFIEKVRGALIIITSLFVMVIGAGLLKDLDIDLYITWTIITLIILTILADVAYDWVTDQNFPMIVTAALFLVIALTGVLSQGDNNIVAFVFALFVAIWVIFISALYFAPVVEATPAKQTKKEIRKEKAVETSAKKNEPAPKPYPTKRNDVPPPPKKAEPPVVEPKKTELPVVESKKVEKPVVKEQPKKVEPPKAEPKEELPKLKIMSSREAAMARDARKKEAEAKVEEPAPVEEIKPEPVKEEPVKEVVPEVVVKEEPVKEEPAELIVEPVGWEKKPQEDEEGPIIEVTPEEPEEEEIEESFDDFDEDLTIEEDTPDALLRRATWNKGLRCRRDYGEHQIPIAFVKAKVAVYVLEEPGDSSADEQLWAEGWIVFRYLESEITDGKEQAEDINKAVKENLRAGRAAKKKKSSKPKK